MEGVYLSTLLSRVPKKGCIRLYPEVNALTVSIASRVETTLTTTSKFIKSRTEYLGLANSYRLLGGGIGGKHQCSVYKRERRRLVNVCRARV